jgi:PhnB protein
MSDFMSDQYFTTLTPYIVVSDAKAAIAFYEKALGAKTRSVANSEDGKIMNAQLVIGNSVLMLNDEFPDYGSLGPQPGDRLPVTIHMNSKDVNADWQRAVDAGMEITMPLEDQFWGDRYGQLRCPYGYNWSMGQKSE